jgi:hypothetical protein
MVRVSCPTFAINSAAAPCSNVRSSSFAISGSLIRAAATLSFSHLPSTANSINSALFKIVFAKTLVLRSFVAVIIKT